MNKENLAKVIEAIKSLKPNKLAMNLWLTDNRAVAFDNCGTAGCIGGWAEAVAALNGSRQMAHSFLDLTPREADDLFYIDLTRYEGTEDERDTYYTSINQAFTSIGIEAVRGNSLPELDTLDAEYRKAIVLNVLQILHDTGKVRWAEAITNTPKPLPITQPAKPE